MKIRHAQDFKQELDVMTQLRGPNLVALYSVVVEPRICLIIEYCSGGALYNLLKSDDFKLKWDRFFIWMTDIVKGVRALHSAQIVHRDIKTLNLLIDENYHIKVADFGLARFTAKEAVVETLSKLRGTYCYTAPEIYFGKTYTSQSDMYSLSIVMWEMVYKIIHSGYVTPYSEYPQILFDFQIIIAVAKKNIRPTMPSQTPPILAQLITVLWDINPTSRPNCDELLSVLKILHKDYFVYKDEWEDTNGCSFIANRLDLSVLLPRCIPSSVPIGTPPPLSPPSSGSPRSPVQEDSLPRKRSWSNPPANETNTRSILRNKATRQKTDDSTKHTQFIVSTNSSPTMESVNKSPRISTVLKISPPSPTPSVTLKSPKPARKLTVYHGSGGNSPPASSKYKIIGGAESPPSGRQKVLKRRVDNKKKAISFDFQKVEEKPKSPRRKSLTVKEGNTHYE
uniref:Protein kinase domain-containing protein n=1 Tax=Arcella intermedia TaxID=1963864 RepID=A0A6B2L1P1_9EUKA